ncbi:hypothetical protein EVG20_g3474 [Dentipellis fragilis]|uniref:BZIP domain-containing protein n=1 Tax=Dentipellis fragilis TaxID=205917 RepID=A0A4Y9Z4D7_9AGAM|nr:hypothetical protein EVG20_g3474 [Dentipellis fragilis]
MLVDNPLQPSLFTLNNPDMSEFFNIDLMLGSSSQQQAASSSRSSSHSPHSAFSSLPSPPTSFNPNIAINDNQATDFFNFYLEDEYAKVDPLAPPPMATSAAPFDFLGAFAPSGSSPESGNGSADQSPPFSIDPQLVGTPATSKALSDIDEHEEAEMKHEDDHEDDEDDESFLSIAPVKVGGKGKGRRGTVQSGGITKKAAPVVSAVVRVRDDDKDDDWRPSPEEYKKMSSKEKRQLRNKISARNFRVRRKEHRAAQRDLFAQEGAPRRRGRAESPVLPPPGPLPVPAARPASTKPALLTPNMHKDLPTSPRMGNGKAFWGGSAAFGGITPVHTTLIPESFAQPLVGKPVTPRNSSLQENINPSLNGNNTTGLAAAAFGSGPGKAGKPSPAAFDMFADSNPFTMKMLDAYRMQLWTRMAAQQQQQNQHAASQTPAPHKPITGLASNLRPHYFTSASPSKAMLQPSSSNSPLSALLAGKHYPTPPTSPKLTPAAAPKRDSNATNAEHAMIAAMASQTLFQRLGSAFWDAFSGSSPAAATASGSGSPRTQWDADKVRRVLEGKAVVRVVDIEEPRAPAAAPPSIRKMQSTPQMQTPRDKHCDCFTKTLEESMRALSLGKKQA